MTRKLIMAFAAVAAAFGAWAETEETVGGYTWTYRINGDTAAIFNNYSVAISPSPTGTVTIPSTLGGKPVTSIGDRAFTGCSGLTSVTIPDSVTRIGYDAFRGCSGLTSVTLGRSVKSIDAGAFCDCSGLTSIAIPESVTEIDIDVFSGCTQLSAIHTPSLEAWCAISFYGKENTSPLCVAHNLYVDGTLLQHLTIPDGLTTIPWNQFEGCESLRSVTIPEGVKTIDRFAFRQCTNLESVFISDSVTIIGWEAFAGCSGLTNVTIGSGVKIIDEGAFRDCNSLASVTIPDSVTSIGSGAFYGCRGLSRVTLEGDCPAVAWNAFLDISAKRVVRLPIGNETYNVVDGKWQGMTVEYYDPSDAPTITVGEKGTVEACEDGGYVVTAKEGETLTAEDFTFIVAPKAAYKVVIADGGATATVSLNEPQVGVLPEQAEEAPKDEDDKSGLLVEVADSMISEKPEAKAGEVVGALPVKTYPGLWYKVAWGDDLSDLTEGRKVQATGDSLYLGVIKQKGPKGFYRLTVSEQ